MTQAIATTRQPGTIAELITAQMPAIALVIGGSTPAERQRKAERFSRIALTAVRQNPKLAQCSQASFAASLMTCAQLDLEPNTPQQLAHLIPYKGECTFQPGYPGLMELAYRTGKVSAFHADVVYRKEVEAGLFKYTKGLDPTIHHEVDLLGDSREGELVAAYAVAKMKDGATIFRVVDAKEVARARKSSQGAGSSYSPWNTDPESMWIKTALKRLCKLLPRTEQLSLAIELDDKAERGESQSPALPTAASTDALNAALYVPAGHEDEGEVESTAQAQPTEKTSPKAQSKPTPAPESKEIECAMKPGVIVRTGVECQTCAHKALDCDYWLAPGSDDQA